MENRLYSLAFIIDYLDLLHGYLVIYRAATQTRHTNITIFYACYH